MAKKKLILNESTTRQFMKYANIKPTYVSNFLKEAEEMEDEMEMEEPAEDMEADPEMDMGMETEDEMEMEEPAEEGGDAEAMVMDLLGAIKDWAKSQGVSMELEGDEEEEDEGMEDMDAAPEGGDMGMADDVDADLEAADAEALDDEEVIAEVTRRVARRLLRESAKRR